MSEIVGVQGELKTPRVSLFKLFTRGLWSENPGLCQLLGMCPLLAVTTTATSALGLALATALVMLCSSLIISCLRFMILREVRIPIYVLLIATLVTVVRFYVQAYYPDLYDQLGIYLALIVTNCIIMGRAEAFAGRNNPLRATADAAGSALGFGLVLFALGSVREILGNGTWMHGAAQMLGPWAASLSTTLIESDYTLLTAVLPPGGFFVLALFIAGKNALTLRRQRKAELRLQIKSVMR